MKAPEQQIHDIKELVKDDLSVVNKRLSSVVKNHTQLIEEVGDNIFSAGGKRIRPILNILSGKLFGYESDELYNLATAVELIHSATLLHDDVIDNSSLRRGKETTNQIYGNKSAILVGDFLFAESFKLMVSSKSLDALMILANASSVISEGEIQQLELLKSKSLSKNKYFEIIKAKTAILFGAATESAASLAGRSSGECKLLRDFGINLGLAFQIVDDILDYSSKAKEFGKDIGNDFFEKKITLPIILLYERSTKLEQKEIVELFNNDSTSNSDLNHLISILENKNIFNYCFDYSKSYVNQSLNILNNLPRNGVNDILQSICYIVLSRTY